MNDSDAIRAGLRAIDQRVAASQYGRDTHGPVVLGAAMGELPIAEQISSSGGRLSLQPPRTNDLGVGDA